MRLLRTITLLGLSLLCLGLSRSQAQEDTLYLTKEDTTVLTLSCRIQGDTVYYRKSVFVSDPEERVHRNEVQIRYFVAQIRLTDLHERGGDSTKQQTPPAPVLPVKPAPKDRHPHNKKHS